MTNNTCDKCRYFTVDSLYTDTGSCALTGDINNFYPDFEEKKLGIDPTKAYGSDSDCYSASVVVGSKFGCIHWAQKETALGIKEKNT